MDETPHQRSRAVKNENQPTGTLWTRNGSPEHFLSQESGKIFPKRNYFGTKCKRGFFMSEYIEQVLKRCIF